MAAREIEENPELAHEHAKAAVSHAGRVAVARETLAITAYTVGDFSLALRELRTLRRISGRNEHVAMIVDSERGVGRPEKALEEGTAANREELETAQRVQLAIAMSGARLDLGQTELALAELDIDELDPDVAYSWSPGLFAARAAVLEDLGLESEAEEWNRRAEVAAEAIAQEMARDDQLVVDEIEEIDLPDDAEDDVEDEGDDTEAVNSVDADGPVVADPDEAGTAGSDTTDEEDGAEPSGGAAEGAEGDRPTAPDAAQAAEAAEGADADGVAGEAGGSDDAAGGPDASTASGGSVPDPDFAVEDEVAEILVEAGVDEPGEAQSADGAADAAGADAPAVDAEQADAAGDEGEDRPGGALF
ncbi:hypothetical protein [Microbacterium halophytorum]|uniref:hypothetical protein n=1 Tax=Microbacterium halophytorum TaxID=2067568 RepID=UPI001E3DDD26|nr:hypothetical protein [Microbacterium halophytorum]